MSPCQLPDRFIMSAIQPQLVPQHYLCSAISRMDKTFQRDEDGILHNPETMLLYCLVTLKQSDVVLQSLAQAKISIVHYRSVRQVEKNEYSLIFNKPELNCVHSNMTYRMPNNT